MCFVCGPEATIMVLSDISQRKKKSLVRINAEINNSKSTISDNRTQPQISGAFLFLTKFRNSVYFLNDVYCFSQKYAIPSRFILHKVKIMKKISPVQIYKWRKYLQVLFSLKPRIVFKKINLNSSFHEAVASLPH